VGDWSNHFVYGLSLSSISATLLLAAVVQNRKESDYDSYKDEE
jgi:hypothetical protein